MSSKLGIKIFIFLCLVGAIFYYGSIKINNLESDLQKSFLENGYELSFKKARIKLGIIKNVLIIQSVSIKEKTDYKFSNTVDIDQLNGTFNIFSLLFTKSVLTDLEALNLKLKLYYSSFDLNKDNVVTIDEFLSEFKKLSDVDMSIKNSRVIYHDKNGIPVKDIREINGTMLRSATNFKTDLTCEYNGVDFAFQSDFKILDSRANSGIGYISTPQEKFSYKFDVNYGADGLVDMISGAIKSSGNNISNLASLLSQNLGSNIDRNASNSFNLESKIRYNKETRDIMLDDITYSNNNDKFNIKIKYNIDNKKASVELKSDSVKLFDLNEDSNLLSIKKNIISSNPILFSNIYEYLSFLKNFDLDLSVDFSNVKLITKKITNLHFDLLSENGKILIKNFNGLFDGKHKINLAGIISSNNIRERFDCQVFIPFDSNQDGIVFTVSAIPGNIELRDIKIKSDLISFSGNLFFRNSDILNDLDGKFILSSFDLKHFYDFFDRITEKDNDGALSSILVILNRMKLNTDFSLKCNRCFLNGLKIDETNLRFNVDEKRITLNSDFVDDSSIKMNNKVEIFWDGLKPKLILDNKIDSLNLKSILQAIGITNLNYFLMSEEEFKKSKGQSVWKDFSIDLNILRDVNLKINSVTNKAIWDSLVFSNVKFDFEERDNIAKLNAFKFNIDFAEIESLGNLDVYSQIFTGLLTVKNLNLNSLKAQQDITPVYLSLGSRFAFSGSTFRQLIADSSASVDYLVYNLSIPSIDVNLFVGDLDDIYDQSSLVSLAERAVVTGKTILDEVKGSIALKDNLLKNTFQFSASRFTGAGIFNVLMENLNFKGLSRIAFITRKYTSPVYTDVNWSGSLFNVSKNFNVDELKNIVSRNSVNQN
jgi:hypothetical protein